jgi:hypothetical protein
LPVARKLLKNTDDLYIPDYRRNIYKILPTALRCLGRRVPLEDLCGFPEVRAHLEKNTALGAKRVIVCLVDSLGVDNIQDTRLGKLYNELDGLALSSTFPTITSSAVTSIHMGVPPTKHGILGHRIYFDEYGTVVDTLRMAGQGVRIRDALVTAGVDVTRLRWSKPVVDLLSQQSESPIIHADGLPSHIAGTGLGHLFVDKPNILSYADYVDAFGMTRRLLDHYPGEPIFATLYFGLIDYFAHKYGPYSPEYREGCDSFLRQLRIFVERLTPNEAKETTIIICSDHGQTQIREKRKIVFSKAQLQEVKGALIGPPGHSGRVMHFYCAGADNRKRLKQWLKDHVEDRALILDSREIGKSRLFPGKLTQAMTSRLGDLLLICREGVDVEVERDYYYSEKARLLPSAGLVGHHGSLSRDELYTPFLAFNAQRL